MNSRRTPLIIGIVLAIGTGFLLLNYLAQARGSAQAATTRTVVVTTRDVPARGLVTADMLETQQRSADQVDPSAIGDAKTAEGKLALITLPAGSIVTSTQLSTPAELALPMRLAHGLRAVSISIDRVKGVAGLIEPGDRVDIIAVAPKVGDDVPKVMTILRGVLVLALGNETETASATAAPDNENLTTVTLAVSPQQANLLALADVYTTLRLALRSPNEPLRSFPTEALNFGTTPHQALAATSDERIVAAPDPAPIAAQTQPIADARTPAPALVPVAVGDRIVYGGGDR